MSRPARPSGFTLLELLVVLGILALGVSVLLPSLCSSKERANRVKCASNLRQIGQGLLLYANDNKGHFPRTRARPCAKSIASFTRPDASDPFAPDGPADNDVTAALFLLIRQADLNPEVFNCPSSNQDKDTLNNLPATSRSNFTNPNNLSYSVANMYPSRRAEKSKYQWHASVVAAFAIMADRNQCENRFRNANPSSPASDLKQMNTINHEKEGQNVMFNDGHVEWFTTPFCGASQDQIHTASGKTGPTSDPQHPLDTVLLPRWNVNGQVE